MIILGIETSCDETAAAIVEGKGEKVKVLSNLVSSQIEIHKKYGGVVPEAAAREHVLNILPVVNEALIRAMVNPSTPLLKGGGGGLKFLGANKLDAVAVTIGPGLVTSLLVGVETAKTLAYVWRLPAMAINHVEGHIYANWLKPVSEVKTNIKFPAIILTVSGGHTMLILMTDHGQYKILGETRDDAAGEAFDKAAQLLGLGYPGGPAIATEAAKLRIKNLTSPTPLSKGGGGGLSLPRPMIRDKNLDFSFSGLKTALFYALKQDRNWHKNLPAYAAEFQQAVIDVLIHKTIKVAKELNCKTVMLTGGVAANLELREQLKVAVRKKIANTKLIIADLKYCTDNAAMIAAAGYFRARKKDFTPWQKLKTEPNLELK